MYITKSMAVKFIWDGVSLIIPLISVTIQPTREAACD